MRDRSYLEQLLHSLGLWGVLALLCALAACKVYICARVHGSRLKLKRITEPHSVGGSQGGAIRTLAGLV